jgi:NIPSNAP
VIVPDCTVYELRRYTLHPGTRAAFVELFETYLLDTQDAAGMRVLGQFHDIDRPDAFVWLRGFANMERRRASLTEFYYGPVWAAHSAAANAMMIDSDDVLLLESAVGDQSLAGDIGPRPPLGATSVGPAEIELAICPVPDGDTEHATEVARVHRAVGGDNLPSLRTLRAPNNFPQLPVHEDRYVAVTLTRFTDAAAAQQARTAPAYRAAADEIDALADGPVERLRLTPTPRSALR